MSTNAPDTNERIDPRTERALSECMTVLPKGGDIYTVVANLTVSGKWIWEFEPESGR